MLFSCGVRFTVPGRWLEVFFRNRLLGSDKYWADNGPWNSKISVSHQRLLSAYRAGECWINGLTRLAPCPPGAYESRLGLASYQHEAQSLNHIVEWLLSSLRQEADLETANLIQSDHMAELNASRSEENNPGHEGSVFHWKWGFKKT